MDYGADSEREFYLLIIFLSRVRQMGSPSLIFNSLRIHSGSISVSSSQSMISYPSALCFP